MNIRSLALLLGFAALGGLTLRVVATDDPAPASTATKPQYDEKGALIAPGDFRTWIFVGADLSPRYKSPLPDPEAKKDQCAAIVNENDNAGPGAFHNIYINPESYRAYLKTGQFPDPTMLAMEVFDAEERDAKGVLASGQFEGQRTSIEVAVKDSRRPGGGVPWAYYAFDLDEQGKPSRPARAREDRSCYNCHLKHASVDNVWVQFYPVLRDRDQDQN